MNAEIDTTIDVAFDELDDLQVEIGATDRLPEQTKQVTITENGSHTITADEGKTLKQVDVEAKVFPKIKPTSLTFQSQKETSFPTNMIDISNMKGLSFMFESCQYVQSIDVRDWDTTNITSLYGTFSFWSSKIKRLDIGHFKTSNVTDMRWLFRAALGLEWVDLSGWDAGTCRSFSSWLGSIKPNNDTCYSLKTIIGDHTLAEVENGTIVALKDAGLYNGVILYIGTPAMRYSSLLAFCNGMYDRSEMSANSLQMSNTAFTNMRNDDDTIPDAATATERQTKIRAIAAAKNWTLTLL